MKVQIRCEKVSNLSARTKFDPDSGDQVTTLTIEVYMEPGTLAKILSLQKQRVPFYFELGSEQAVMDLETFGFRDPEAVKVFSQLIKERIKEAVPA